MTPASNVADAGDGAIDDDPVGCLDEPPAEAASAGKPAAPEAESA